MKSVVALTVFFIIASVLVQEHSGKYEYLLFLGGTEISNSNLVFKDFFGLGIDAFIQKHGIVLPAHRSVQQWIWAAPDHIIVHVLAVIHSMKQIVDFVFSNILKFVRLKLHLVLFWTLPWMPLTQLLWIEQMHLVNKFIILKPKHEIKTKKNIFLYVNSLQFYHFVLNK